MSRKPDFFIIGAPKSGTTSMYEYLKGHPQVYMSPSKEPKYFSPDVLGGRPRRLHYPEDEAGYLALFDGAGEAKRVGEASTTYLYSPKAATLIHDFQPAAWIVAMLRDPVEMVYAMHNERVSNGREEILDFEEALEADEDRHAGRRLPPGSNELGATYRHRALFGAHLKRWFETFGRERIHVIIFEDMVVDPAAAFRRLLQFLDVDDDYVPPSFTVYNASHRRRRGPLRRLLRSPLATWTARDLLPRVLGPDRATNVMRSLHHSRLDRRVAPRPPLAPNLRRRLELEFASDVALLSELLDRDVAALWWNVDRSAGTPDLPMVTDSS